MSRQSENSKAESEGNGDSMLSSYQNSPRKTPEFGSAGPFGDHCTENKSPNCFIFMMNNDSSTESEDEPTNDLKTEYLERLDIIRQKLASIDIANYGSYYNNCCDYPSSYSPRCQITEIFDESQKEMENINTENVFTRTNSVVISNKNEATVSKTYEDQVIQDFDNKNAPQKEERRTKSNYTERVTKDYLENRNKNDCKKILPIQDQEDTEDTSCINKNSNLETQTLPEESKNSKDSSYKSSRTKTDPKYINTEKNISRSENINSEDLKYDLGTHCTQQEIINAEKKYVPRVENTNIIESPNENQSTNCDSKNVNAIKSMLEVENENIEDFMTECDDNKNLMNNVEVKTIFKFDNPYDVDSAVELIDLNYNPPKKKYCIREKTPKIIMSDGAMSLPYHIRVSLHDEALKTKVQEPIEIDEASVADRVKLNIKHLEQTHVGDNIVTEEKTNHIFPEVQVDCFGGGDQEEIVHKSSGILHKFTNKEAPFDSPRKSAGINNEYSVFFFETVEQSPVESVRSHRTIVTETTISDSPPRKPKRRRLLLRSAQNKVKPLDNISLWEEIRTMEALNKQKQESSSSLESYFKDVIIYKERTDTEKLPEDLISVESLDVPPPKTKLPARFPSITKIRKFCTSIFRKKSVTFIENNTDANEESKEDLNKSKEDARNKKRVIEKSPKAAHMLLNVRKGQDLDVEIDQVTLSDENFSDCSEVDDEDDSYYEGNCPICFCF